MLIDNRERKTTIELSGGRTITIGAGVDVDPGVWMLHDVGLLRWLTSDDARKIAAELIACADHFEANPPKKRR